MARLLISLMVLTIFIVFSSAFPDRKVQRHADGLFTSELSKIKNDIAVRNYMRNLLAGRVQRHAEGLFTSELSKIKNDIAVRNYLKNLLASKRSNSDMSLLDNLEDIDARSEEVCPNCLYQDFPSESVSDQEATQENYRLI